MTTKKLILPTLLSANLLAAIGVPAAQGQQPDQQPTPAEIKLLVAKEQASSDPAAAAQAAIDKGLGFLKSQQQSDGGWAKDKEPPAITALVLKALLQDAGTKDADEAKKGLAKLLTYQAKDGGIYKDLLSNYNTAIAVSALSKSTDPAAKAAVEKAIAYLRTLQWTEETRPEFVGKNEDKPGQQVVTGPDDAFYGGWGYGGRSRGAGRPDISNLQLTLDAFRDAGVPPTDPAYQKALSFVTRLQNNSETNQADWAGNDGGFIYGPSGDRRGESMAGEFKDAEGKRRLRSAGAPSYAGLKSMIYAGLDQSDPRVKAAWGWVTANWNLDAHVGSLDPAEAKNGYNYYIHVLARALHAYGEPTFTAAGKQVDWRVELITKLASLQNADGSFPGAKKYMEDNPVLSTAFLVLALQEAQADLKDHPAK